MIEGHSISVHTVFLLDFVIINILALPAILLDID